MIGLALTEARLLDLDSNTPRTLARSVRRLVEQMPHQPVPRVRYGDRFIVREWIVTNNTNVDNVKGFGWRKADPVDVLPMGELDRIVSENGQYLSSEVLPSSLPRLAGARDHAVAADVYPDGRYCAAGETLFPHQVHDPPDSEEFMTVQVEQGSLTRYSKFHESVAELMRNLQAVRMKSVEACGFQTTGISVIDHGPLAAQWLSCGENRFVLSAISGHDYTRFGPDHSNVPILTAAEIELIEAVAADGNLAVGRPLSERSMTRIERANRTLRRYNRAHSVEGGGPRFV